MHQSILTPLHVTADKTVITTIQCTVIFGQHVLIQSITLLSSSYSPYFKHVLEFTFCGLCIMIYLLNKDQQDALFSLNLFQYSILYMFE